MIKRLLFSILFTFGLSENIPPISPTIYAKADSGKIILNWTSESENSIDSITNYRDFAGYRIYKSTDGGITWGTADDRIYYNGVEKGWTPLVQFDLTAEEDSLYCIKIEDCNIEEDGTRGAGISGVDPIAPWVDLGSDTGLEYTFTDDDVYNGKEYTYAIVAYDIGLRTFELSYESIIEDDKEMGECSDADALTTIASETDCCSANDGSWDDDLNRCEYSDCNDCNWIQLFNEVEDWHVTNPDSISSSTVIIDGDTTIISFTSGLASIESNDVDVLSELISSGEISIDTLAYVVTAIPGFYAENIENISFDGVENADGIILNEEANTVGNGPKSFVIVNQDDLSNNVYRFEIQASASDDEVFEGYKSEDPSLYVYEINSLVDNTPKYFNSYELYEENIEQIFESLSLELTNECNSELVAFYDVESCLEGLGELIIDLPGATVDVDEINYNVPEYKFEDFKLKYLDDLGYSSNFTDFIDGLKFRFDNSLRSLPDDKVASLNSIKYVTEIEGIKDTTEIENSEFFSVKLKYGNNGSAFSKKPPYAYKIKFSESPIYPVDRTVPSSGCSDNPNNTLIPFEITNLTTGKVVAVYHTDYGTMYNEDNCTEICASDQWCNNGVCEDLKGYKDCFWEVNENIAFKKDTVSTSTEIDSEEYTFDLQIDFRLFMMASRYDSSASYAVGDIVRRSEMVWEAVSEVSPEIYPTDWIDSNDDGVNDNPWNPVYPWNDGDEIIIQPTSWYVDGDAWIADFSQLGKKLTIEENHLENVSVVPNPYFVNSRFDETPESRLMWFTHLPTECYISIYTVSGELVTSFNHADNFDGQASWDLRTGNGDEVAPGLYIYTVESGSNYQFKHIGKFAIVR